MKILKNVGLVIASLILSFISFLNHSVGSIYEGFFGQVKSSGSMFDIGPSSYALTQFVGIIPVFELAVTILFTAFGDDKKYYWIGVLMLPVLWFVIKFDLAHWYFYLALALVGWLIGLVLNKIIATTNRANAK